VMGDHDGISAACAGIARTFSNIDDVFMVMKYTSS